MLIISPQFQSTIARLIHREKTLKFVVKAGQMKCMLYRRVIK